MKTNIVGLIGLLFILCTMCFFFGYLVAGENKVPISTTMLVHQNGYESGRYDCLSGKNTFKRDSLLMRKIIGL